MDVTVIVTTHGIDAWADKARAVAVPSAEAQARTVHHHGTGTLAASRNEAVDLFDPQGWICFLDADDTLGGGYMTAMRAANPSSDLSLLTPALGFFDGTGPRQKPMALRKRDILTMNPCPIGTLIHRDVFESAGRFWEEPAWEDWSLFRRAHLLGCPVVFVDDAHYWAKVDPLGRNSTVPYPRVLHQAIVDSHTAWAAAR